MINNKHENSKGKDHAFKVNNLALVKQTQTAKYSTKKFCGPYPIVSINDNGTLCLQEGSVLVEMYNVRQVAPYQQ